MKTEYKIKDTVWIHIGERTLVGGRVVDIIDLQHLNEGHTLGNLYVIEIKTGIDDVYEVRTFDQISPDSTGPINLFRKNDVNENIRYLKKIGIKLPVTPPDPLSEMLNEDLEGPTAAEIHAALEKSQKDGAYPPLVLKDAKPRQTKRRTFKRKPKE
jgi:hypothetical protein